MPISTIPVKWLNSQSNQYTSRFEVISERESLVERYLGKVEVGGSKAWKNAECPPQGSLLSYQSHAKLTLYQAELLSQQQLDFLAGKVKCSKKIERNLRYKIRKKVDAFKAVELPLLIEAGLLDISTKHQETSLRLETPPPKRETAANAIVIPRDTTSVASSAAVID
jgi:hypothetical protein